MIEPCAEGEESVWDFPRPPIVRSRPGEYRVEFNGEVIACSNTILEVCETAGAPVPYFPPADVRRDCLIASGAVPVIRDQVASILEGGRDAFIQRKEKYEF